MSSGGKPIAIVGMAGDLRLGVPWGNPDWEIWTMAHDQQMIGVTRTFEMHAQRYWNAFPGGWDDHLARLEAYPCPVVMAEPHRDVRQAERYPFDEVNRLIQSKGYFTSSTAWMLAYAILQGPDRIELWGVSGRENHIHQRPNLEYLIGLARGRGIDLWIPAGSDLLKCSNGRYGLDW